MASAAATSTASAGCSASFTGLLTILFTALKLTHEIVWNWLWVLSPLWIGASLLVLGLVALAGIVGTAGIVVLLRRSR